MTQRSTASKRISPGTTRRGIPRFRFISEIIGELRKVVWLTRRELTYLTGLVLVVAITMALIMGVIDFAFSKLVNSVFLGG
jgi:preprotein translocase SecE subunit